VEQSRKGGERRLGSKNKENFPRSKWRGAADEDQKREGIVGIPGHSTEGTGQLRLG